VLKQDVIQTLLLHTHKLFHLNTFAISQLNCYLIHRTFITRKQFNQFVRMLLVIGAIVFTLSNTVESIAKTFATAVSQAPFIRSQPSDSNKNPPDFASAQQGVLQKGSKKKRSEVRSKMVNDSLKAELKSASLVIKGKVMQTDIEDEKIRPIISEHDPGFKKAIIQVTEVLKGKLKSKQVEVYYASSDDVRWYTSPKLAKDQEAIFILKTEQLGTNKQAGYTLLDKQSIQPVEYCNSIKGILKGNL
jgi:hypothetical protein